jgi:hypothetical protein
MSRPFIKGLDLSELFYKEAVKPILAARFPKVPYSAALLGPGSEVLGFDTPQSTDHDWGPKLMLFLAEAGHAAHRDEIDHVLRQDLPREVRGYPTDFGRHDDGTAVMTADASGPINHGVSFFTVRAFSRFWLNFDIDEGPGVVDWLTIPEQVLRSFTGGRVFHDGLGQLDPLRARLRYYPHGVWLYLLATQWRRISQEEAFVGRCGQVGDEVGSCLVAARLVRDLMRLCFLMERQYAPYIKWFGTAFAQLDCAGELLPVLTQVLRAESWQEREKYLSSAYEFVARMHNDLDITEPLPAQVSNYYNRPFLVIHGDRFADAIYAAITDEKVLALPPALGGIDQFVDSTDVLTSPGRLGQLKLTYRQRDEP